MLEAFDGIDLLGLLLVGQLGVLIHRDDDNGNNDPCQLGDAQTRARRQQRLAVSALSKHPVFTVT